MKIFLFPLLLAAPAVAHAAPVYLSCNIPNQGNDFTVDATLNEAEGTVSLFMPSTDNRETLQGTFTPDKVLFSNRMMSYTLSRVDLSLVRVVPLLKSRETGQCRVQTPPQRAF